MRWRNPRRSGNIEDRRGRIPMKAVGGGIGGIIVLVIALLLGGDPGAILNDAPTDISSNVDPSSLPEEERVG
jgi:uncharacterized protein